MRLWLIMLSAIILASCTKENATDKCELAEPDWVQQKREQFSSCACLTSFYKAKFKDVVIYEIAVADPLCNGINVVYNYEGFIQFTSGDIEAYQEYIQQVKGRQMIWSCSK